MTISYIALDRDSAQPLYAQLAAHLRTAIESGCLEAGQDLPRERDLAANLGVSRVTVRHALAILREHGLIQRTRGKGAFVHGDVPAPPRFAPWHQGRVVGIATQPYLEGHSIGLTVAGAAVVLEAAGYVPLRLTCLDGSDCRRRLEHFCDLLAGVILQPATGHPVYRECIDLLAARDIPAVVASFRLEAPGVDNVWIDDVDIGRRLTAPLLVAGCRRFAFLRSTVAPTDRQRGCEAVLAAEGLRPTIVPVPADDRHEQLADRSYAAVAQLLAGPRPPDAIVASNDMLALGAWQAVLDSGRRCPDDVAVVGVADGDGLDPWFAARDQANPIAAVRLPRREIGEQAARTLLERFDRPGSPGRRVVVDAPFVQHHIPRGGGSSETPFKAPETVHAD